MHRYVALPFAIGVLLFAVSVRAEPAGEVEEIRVHLGASGAYTFLLRAEDEFSGGAIDTEVEPSFGAALRYGVRAPNGLAVDIDLEWNEGFGIEQSTAVGTVSDDIRTYLLTSSIGFHPLEGRFDPFVAVGGGWMRASLADFGESDDGVALRLGAGADLWISEHLGLRLEGRYVLPLTDSIEDLDFAGPRAGLVYRF